MKQTWTLTSEARLSRLILGCIAVDRSTPLKPSYDTRNSPWFSPSSTTPSFIQTLDDNVNLYEAADERENFLLSRKILLPPRRAGGDVPVKRGETAITGIHTDTIGTIACRRLKVARRDLRAISMMKSSSCANFINHRVRNPRRGKCKWFSGRNSRLRLVFFPPASRNAN